MGRENMRGRSRGRRRLAALAAVAASVGALVTAAPARAGEVELLPVRQVGGPGHAGLYGWGAAAAPDGSVYISDYWNYRIQHYAKDGTLLGTVVPKTQTGAAAHQAPYGIGVDPRNGDIYFGDVDSNATVDKYSASGQFLLEFGSKGDGYGYFDYPSRVAVAPDGTVVVSDSRSEKLAVYDDAGHVLFEKAGVLFGTPVLGRPRGIALDAAGYLYVADALLQQVQVFRFNETKTDLVFQRSIGIKKSHPGEPLPGELGLDLRGIAADDAHDLLYVVDADTGYIAKFRKSDGSFLSYFGGEGSGDGEFSGGGRDVAVDGDGNVWVGDMPNFRAQKFAPDGTFLQKVPDPPQPPPTGGFDEPRSVAVDAAGNMFVTDTHNWRIQKFDAAGQFVKQWGSRGPDADQFNYAKGIAVDYATGDVVVADSDGNAIKKFDNNGNPLCLIDKHGTDVGQFQGPLSLDVGSDHRIYVADTQNGRVQVLETVSVPGGCDLRVRATNGVLGGKGTTDGKFQAANGIAVDSDGSLWVSDRLLGRVTHFANDGTFLGKFGAGVGTTPQQFQRAGDVEVDAQYVYVSDSDANQIKVWRKNGTFVRTYGAGGYNLGQFQRPQGMDLLPNGHLYVAEQTAERVQELTVGFNLTPETTRPDGLLAVPAANQKFPLSPITFSGTATDNTGVLTVQVAIKNVTSNQWWTGSGWGAFTWLYSSVAPSGLGATSTNWTFGWTPPAAGSYGIQARAQDVWGNVDSTVPYRTFSVFAGVPDSTAPQGQMTLPTAGQTVQLGPVTFAGTATDNVGVTGAEVAIKSNSLNKWWTGSAWGTTFTWLPATVAAPGATSTTFSFPWTPDAAGSYGMQARVRDAAGNYGNIASRNFTVSAGPPDTTAPQGAISVPVANQQVPNGAVTFSGTATDNVGVTVAEVAIKNSATGQWWTGSAWGTTFTWLPATVAAPGATSTTWSRAWTPPATGNFGMQARVKDAAGNTTNLTFRTFKVV